MKKVLLIFIIFISCKTEENFYNKIPTTEKELIILNIDKREGYNLIKGLTLSKKDTLTLICNNLDNQKLKEGNKYKFKLRDIPLNISGGGFGFSHMIVKNDTLWSGNIKDKNRKPPSFYRILEVM